MDSADSYVSDLSACFLSSSQSVCNWAVILKDYNKLWVMSARRPTFQWSFAQLVSNTTSQLMLFQEFKHLPKMMRTDMIIIFHYIFSHLLRIYYLVNIRVLQLVLYTGLTIEARTGRNKVAVATLLVHSVKMAIKRHRMITMAQGGILCRGVNWFPIHLDRPDSWDIKEIYEVRCRSQME